jgi:hypothetical protein
LADVFYAIVDERGGGDGVLALARRARTIYSSIHDVIRRARCALMTPTMMALMSRNF